MITNGGRRCDVNDMPSLEVSALSGVSAVSTGEREMLLNGICGV